MEKMERKKDGVKIYGFLLAVFCLPFLLSACGWQPVYGTPGPAGSGPATAEDRLDSIEISTIPDAEGVYLRNALIDRFYRNGYPAMPLYRLQLSKINETTQDFDITVESEATRRQLRLSTVLVLTDLQTGQKVLERNLSAVTSYNVLESEFATRVSEQDGRESALNDLARQTELQIALFFRR